MKPKNRKYGSREYFSRIVYLARLLRKGNKKEIQFELDMYKGSIAVKLFLDANLRNVRLGYWDTQIENSLRSSGIA